MKRFIQIFKSKPAEIEVYSSGIYTYEVPYNDNGEIHGIAKQYFSQDRILFRTTSYKFGLKHGKSKTFFRNGELCSVNLYKNGKIKKWGKNKKLKKTKTVMPMLTDISKYSASEIWEKRLSGFVKTYHENGKLKIETPIINGLAEGIQSWYNEDGKVQLKVLCRDGIELQYFRNLQQTRVDDE